MSLSVKRPFPGPSDFVEGVTPVTHRPGHPDSLVGQGKVNVGRVTVLYSRIG
jgi:hypothetical protein